MAPPGDASATVFVYGTLLDPTRADAVLGEWRDHGAAVLSGLHRVEGQYPTLAPGGETDGRLLRTPELDRLDAYEGVDRGLYVRVAVPVAGAREGSGTDPGDRAVVYVGDPDRLGASATWPGDGDFAERVGRYLDAHDVVVVPSERWDADSTDAGDRQD